MFKEIHKGTDFEEIKENQCEAVYIIWAMNKEQNIRTNGYLISAEINIKLKKLHSLSW